MKNQVFRKKLNDDGTPYIDPVTNDFVSELVYEESIVIPIEQALEEKIKEIDSNTEKLIYKGFEYDGFIFSLSAKAQLNWSNFPNLPENIFPLTVSSKNDEAYVLEYKDKMSFYYTAVGTTNGHLQSGNALKQQILQLKDSESILNFKDDRISS